MFSIFKFFKVGKSHKKDKTPPMKNDIKYPFINELFIVYKDGSPFSYTVDTTANCGKVEPWKHFFKWYFNKNTDSYMFTFNGGVDIIRRDQIKSIHVKISERIA